MRAEDEVGGGGGPLLLARPAITALVHILVRGRWSPRRIDVEQIHEEVVGERFRPIRENAVLRSAKVGVQRTHTANEYRHLRRGELQEVGALQQTRLG